MSSKPKRSEPMEHEARPGADRERPGNAALFDIATRECERVYGQRFQASTVVIATAGGLKLQYDVPPGWEPEPENRPARLPNGEAIAEILATIIQTGHRLTREQVIDAMEEHGRKRAASIIGDSLALLVKLGILNNVQDTEHNGYGLRSWNE